MKLATYRDGSRDGQLVVVSRDLATAHFANGIATRLQQVLDDWNFLSPQLEDLSATLNHGKARHAFPFDAAHCMAPLPRAYQWLDASAYPSHAERIAQGRGQSLPDDWLAAPRMYQGGSDDLRGPAEDIWFGAEAWQIDLEAELVAVTGDVEMGASDVQGLDGIRLLMLANDWSLRGLIPAERATGFGFLQGKPATSFAPVAVTPDELGEAWQHGRAALQVDVALNRKRLGRLRAGEDCAFHFGQLIAHAAMTRHLRAGSLVGAGTISNRAAAAGFGCLIEARAVEQAAHGAPRSGWLAFGDRVRIEALDAQGQSVFGALDQRVIGPGMADGAAGAAADGAPDTGPHDQTDGPVGTRGTGGTDVGDDTDGTHGPAGA